MNLINAVPKSKSAQIRQIWPDINAALQHGHTIKQIWECLAKDGLEISYGKLRWHIAMLKRADPQNSLEPSKRVAPKAVGPVRRDVLANLRARMNKRPGFEYNEALPDIRKLI